MSANTNSAAWTWVKNAFGPDYQRYEGVYKINIYLLRLLYLLVVIFVATDSWTAIFTHQGPWDHVRAVAFCVWAAYSTLSILGLIHPLKMIPIVLFEIFYKSIWLIIVAYPLRSKNQLAGSPAETMTYAFLWLPLPLLAVPWGYTFRTYFSFSKKSVAQPQSDPRISIGKTAPITRAIAPDQPGNSRPVNLRNAG